LPPLLCAGITVYAPLKRYQKIGAKCAIIGIGGLGHVAIQFANKLGMIVTAFTTKINNVDSLKQLGANDIQNSTNLEELANNEGKYDIVLSTLFIDNPVLYKLHQRLTKPQGVHIMVGIPDNDAIYKIDNDYLINNEITIAGSNVGSINEVKEMLQFIAYYGIKSINEYFSFDNLPKAFHRAEKENPKYRAVVNVTDWARNNGFDK
jgi:D-arabinose 1-dehydrogenase-like Zn-dependent alcohol dehydrogenase